MHVIGPELGLTQPGMTIACGDSHTSTHGAFGAIAFGIGTSQVRDVLASQCLALEPLKVRRIDVNGALRPGVYAKDVILTIIRRLGVAGRRRLRVRVRRQHARRDVDRRADDDLQHVDRGRRARRLRQPGRHDVRVPARPASSSPPGDAFDTAVAWWRRWRRIANASYDDRVTLDAASIEPTVTWGINPGQSVGVSEPIPADADPTKRSRSWASTARHPFAGHENRRRVHRLVHQRPPLRLEEAARIVRGHNVAPHVKALMVPGLAGGRPRGRKARPAPGVHRRRLRVARRRLLDVPGDEPGQARRTPGLRVVVESQLQGPARQPDRPDAADEPGDGRGGGDCRRSGRRSRRCSRRCRHEPRQVQARRLRPSRDAASRCAATTSTPTASCRRGF